MKNKLNIEIDNYYEKITEKTIENIANDYIFQSYVRNNSKDLMDYIINKADIKDGQVIYDAGCGVGGPSLYIANNLNVEIHAVTNSRIHYKVFSQLVKTAKIKGKISLYLNDFHSTESFLKSKSFDRVIFLESLSHSNKKTKVIADLYNILNKDGLIYIKEPFLIESECEKRRSKLLKSSKIAGDHYKWHYDITVEKWLLELKKLGVNNVKVDLFPYDVEKTKDNAIIYRETFDVNFLNDLVEYSKCYQIIIRK
jgi:2-polyprenyl-3-methyl-5-hydroxy-6-metoxy-1,4-benzoquinol methylase